MARTPLSPSQYGGHRKSRDGCRRKSVMFFWFSCLFFLSRFGIKNFVTTETLLSSVIFKTIIVPLHTGSL